MRPVFGSSLPARQAGLDHSCFAAAWRYGDGPCNLSTPVQFVEKLGCKKWAYIASQMLTKGSKQCRRRWQNYLNAEVKQGGWSEEEARPQEKSLCDHPADSLPAAMQDALLLVGHEKYGNRWTEIAKVLFVIALTLVVSLPLATWFALPLQMVHGRTDNAVKNRHAVLVKKQAKPDKPRNKKRKGEAEAEADDDGGEEEEGGDDDGAGEDGDEAAAARPPRPPQPLPKPVKVGRKPREEKRLKQLPGAGSGAGASSPSDPSSAAAAVAPGAFLPPPIRPRATADAPAAPAVPMNDIMQDLGLSDFLLASARVASASGVRPGSPLDTPVADMASVFSWFLGATASPRSISSTPTAAAAAAAAALLREGGAPSPTMPPAAAAAKPEATGTADQGRKALLQKLLSGAGLAPAAGGAQTPTGGFKALAGGFSPLSGLRRSPRLAPIRTELGDAAAGLLGQHAQTPDAAQLAELLQSPHFTQACACVASEIKLESRT